MLAAFRRQAVQKSSIVSTYEKCSWLGCGQTDERFAKVVAHKEHEHHQHHRHAFAWQVAQKAKIVSIVSSSVFGTTSEHHQHHPCLCASGLRPEKSCYGCLHCAPSAMQNERQMLLMLLAVCVQKPRGSDADDAGFWTLSVQSKMTSMQMMLACLRQATSNHWGCWLVAAAFPGA